MQPFFEWFAKTVDPSEPWLILGKGPSFALRGDFDLSRFHLISLNHAVREEPVFVAHIIDLDVIEACGPALERNAQMLVMPWYPHVRNEVGVRTLAEIMPEIPVLQRLDAEGRLLWYDLSTSPVRHGTPPVVEATYFSAEAALNLLALAGVRRVRSLGVDGGSAYSGAFEDLRNSTLLANGRTSFDLQFAGFARTILRTGVNFAPLELPAPARIYVAHTSDETLPLAVLQHSVRRRSSLTVELVGLPEGNPGTIEEGQAVLLAPRAQVLVDLRPLWRAAVNDLELVVPEGKVDCGPGLALVGAGLSSTIPALASMIRRRAPLRNLAESVGGRIRATLAADWNPGFRSEADDEALVLYYLPDGSEPWMSRCHPLGHLWVRDLLDAVDRGFVRPELVAEEVRRGHVRPSLLYQVEQGFEEPLLLPRRVRLLDRDFAAAGANRVVQPVPHHWARLSRAIARQVRRRIHRLRTRRSALESTGTPQPNIGVRP